MRKIFIILILICLTSGLILVSKKTEASQDTLILASADCIAKAISVIGMTPGAPPGMLESMIEQCKKDSANFIKNSEPIKNQEPARGLKVLPERDPYLENIPQVGGISIPKDGGIPGLVAFAYNIGLYIVGIVVLGQIMSGGAQWLLSAGNPSKIGEAKSRITNAIFGLIILMSSYVILTTINPDLVKNTFDLPSIGVSGGDFK